MNLSELYKKRLSELAGTKVLSESSVIKDELNSLPFKKDIEAIGGKIYSVGGRVRDEIIGKKSKDLDILVTGVPLERLEHILLNYGKVKEVGKSFGIIKFIPFGETEEIDVAIPRTENKKEAGTGYKGFDVKSDHTLPVEVDLERRDFTMNSIAEDSDGNVIDPFGGKEDLKNKIIRATSEVAFGDDPVRMLRAVQFASRFGFTIEPNTMAMIKKNASRIKEEPPERYITEFDKILKKGNVQMGMDILIESGLFKEIMGFDYVGDKDFSKVKTMADLLYKLVENSNVDIVSFIKKHLINEIVVLNQIKSLELQKKLTGDKYEDRKLVQTILNLSPNIEQSGLLSDDLKSVIKQFKDGIYPLKTTDLEFNGDDLKLMGFEKEQIGKNLSMIMKAILNDDIPNKKEDIANFVKKMNEPKTSSEKKDEDNKDVSPDSINAINEVRKIIRNVLIESVSDKSDDYKKWKRKNVTIRGISKAPGEYNGVGSITLGDGFYTAHLGNKDMARKYGTVYFVVNGRPKNPLVFNNTNESEIWLQRNLYFKNFKDMRDFNKHTTIEDEVQKMGYDGIEIKGREMVNYKPENVLYFKTENELMDYYEKSVKNNIQ
jgi:tRNA nucleotidyltransferase/poly(A) polymerase